MKFKRIGHYKYELLEDAIFVTPIRTESGSYVERDESSRWLVLRPEGELLILEGYAWDGASGPAMDTKSIMRGALVHDGLYQLMREGGLPLSYRKTADKLLRKMCREDGMMRIRAWWVYLAVRIFGKEAAI